MSTLYFFGKQVEGKTYRFLKQFTDHEFQELMADIGGVLPKGVVSWDVEPEELNQRTEKVQKMASYPLVTSWAGVPINPLVEMKLMNLDEEMAKMERKEDICLEYGNELGAAACRGKWLKLHKHRNELKEDRYM